MTQEFAAQEMQSGSFDPVGASEMGDATIATLATAAVEPAPRTEVEASPFFNRELSWLEFNRRVLYEAEDPTVPLLERLKFVAIFGGNLDEFFMKRVGGLKLQAASGRATLSPDGRTPAEQLAAIAAVGAADGPSRQRELLTGLPAAGACRRGRGAGRAGATWRRPSAPGSSQLLPAPTSSRS